MTPSPALSTRFRTGLAALVIGVLAAGSVVASPVVALAATVESGSLSWGVKASFRNYITGPIAGGTATVAGGAVDTGSGYDFAQSSGELDADAGTAAAAYAGSVRFLGHGGALDLTFASPSVRVTGPQSAVLNVTVNGTAVDLATVDLSQATRTDEATGVIITAAPTTLTEAGVPAFANFYTAGTALDPVSFTIAVDAPVVVPSPEPTTEPTTEPTDEPTTEPTDEPTVPATPTVTVSKTTGLDAGGESVTVTGTGFLPATAGETTGTRPPLAGKFTGAYVTFGTFLDTWQPSAGAAASTRKNSDVKWAVSAADQATIGGAAAGAIELKPDGSFETTLTVTKDFAGALADGNYGIYTYPGGGAKYAPFETFTPITFAAPTPTVVVSKTTGLAAAGESVTVTGTGFLPATAGETTGTRPPLAGKFTGAYVTFGTFLDTWQPSAGAAASTRKNSDVKWAVSAADQATIGGAAAGAIELKPDGSFETTLTVTKDFAGALADGNYGIYTYPGGGAKYAPFETFTPITFAAVVEPPVIEPPVVDPPVVTPPVVTPPVVDPPVVTLPVGSLTWSVKSSFLDYVTGPIAHGTITVGGAAGDTTDGFTFPQSSDAFDETTRTGDAGYAGSIRFSGHDGALDLTVENPVIRMGTATTGTLVMTVNGAAVDFATIDIPAASPGAAFRTAAVSSASTAGGVFAVAGATVTLTAAGAAAFAGFYPAGTVLDPISFTVGSAATAPVDPTEPPVVTPPVVTPPVVTPPVVTEPVVTPPATVIPAGSLNWGVKSAFRSYITGPIARGSITPSGGATATDGIVSFPQSSDNFDETARTGSAGYVGAVRFLGHHGALDLTFGAPGIRVDPSGAATLVLDVNGAAVDFGTIDLTAATVSAGAVTYTAAPVTLTAAGAAAFSGFYPAGTALDPVTVTIGATTELPAQPTRPTAEPTSPPTAPTPPVPATPATPVAATPAAGTTTGLLSWGVKQAFRSYVTGTIARGSITVSGGATAADGVYRFGQSGGSLNTAGLGSAGYAGAVRFTGHGGLLDLTFAQPTVRIDSATAATLLVTVNGSTVEFGAIDLGAATRSTPTGAVSYADAPTTLTGAGAAAFAGYYAAGIALDPVSFTVGVAGAAPAGSTGTIAVATVARTAAAAPVAEVPAVAPAAGCLVADATLAWGLKSSFRSYLTGGIANGDWAFGTGTTYAAEQFGWAGGTGSYDPATAAGLLGFSGDVRFTGHDGALDTTLANPQIEIVDANTGYLIVDVTGTTQTGEVVNTPGVRFALLDLAAATENTATDARIELAGVPATLTAAGAAAFGTYPEGEELDPVDLAFSVAAECGTLAAAGEDTAAGSAAVSAADGDDITPVAASADLTWLIWLVVALLVLALLAAIVLLRRRAVTAG